MLRDYQSKIVSDIYAAWNQGYQNVGVQLATGGGKTRIFTHIMAEYPEPSIVIAHRTELVAQASLALAQYGIQHNIVAPRETVQEIVTLHMQSYRQSFYDPQSNKYVAGIDTLIARVDKLHFFKRIGLVIQDEAHHVLRENKWGKAASLFPNAKGLYPTATPQRADGKGLGRQAQGLIDELIIGVDMHELIQRGYLSPYRIIAPPNNLDLTTVNITPSGDYSPIPLGTAVKKAHITGDIVEHYLRVAKDELGITFAVNIESCREIATAYNKAGIPAEVVSSKTPTLLRAQIMRKFRNREILQLVNVDILGEGVDIPAVIVVSLARPTASLNLWLQQAGRALRPKEGGKHAIIIDHVNNYLRHGVPDAERIWSLDNRERRSRSTVSSVPLKVCLDSACMGVYSRALRVCPYCGYYSAPKERSIPAHVDGDLIELDAAVLAAMRGEITRIDGIARIPRNASTIVQLSIQKKHAQRQEAQTGLRHTISVWAALLHEARYSDSEIYRIFYHRFGVDIMTAQTLGVTAASELQTRIITDKTFTTPLNSY